MKTKPKHSPAPWRILEKDGVPVVDAKGNHVCLLDCRFDKSGNPDEFNNFDADLILAAPDLLKALRLCERALEERDAEAEEYAAKLARATIAKAMGKQCFYP